jgi:hypothetical protein
LRFRWSTTTLRPPQRPVTAASTASRRDTAMREIK